MKTKIPDYYRIQTMQGTHATLRDSARQSDCNRRLALQRIQETRRTRFLHCPLCHAESPYTITPETRCDRCRSPLAEPPLPGSPASEIFDRRSSRRVAKSNSATIYAAEHPLGWIVTMRDLSLNGLSFFSEAPLPVDRVFKFQDPNLEALALVVSCHNLGQHYSIHSKLLTVAFHEAGVFLSARG